MGKAKKVGLVGKRNGLKEWERAGKERRGKVMPKVFRVACPKFEHACPKF